MGGNETSSEQELPRPETDADGAAGLPAVTPQPLLDDVATGAAGAIAADSDRPSTDGGGCGRSSSPQQLRNDHP